MISFQKKKRIIDEKLLEEIRNQPCEVCGRPPRSDPHHVTGRRTGDDSRENVIPLCSTVPGIHLGCHRKLHDMGNGPFIERFHAFRQWLERHDRWDVIEKAEYKKQTQRIGG